jgi:hypothetical protein
MTRRTLAPADVSDDSLRPYKPWLLSSIATSIAPMRLINTPASDGKSKLPAILMTSMYSLVFANQCLLPLGVFSTAMILAPSTVSLRCPHGSKSLARLALVQLHPTILKATALQLERHHWLSPFSLLVPFSAHCWRIPLGIFLEEGTPVVSNSNIDWV